MSLESQLNALTRFIFLIFLVFLVFSPKYSTIYLILSLVFIIILYYVQSNMVKESFQNDKNDKNDNHYNSDFKYEDYTTPVPNTACRFCKDPVNLSFDESQYSKNYARVKGQNPRTLRQPVIVPPSHDLESWRVNELVTHSHINETRKEPLFESGYVVSSCCEERGMEKWKEQSEKIRQVNEDIREDYMYKQIDELPQEENGDYNLPSNNNDYINMSCGYNPDQIKLNLPVNNISGRCQEDPSMSAFNKNIHTQRVGPGVYSSSQVIEPINSNIGISFTQQHLPTSKVENKDGSVEYVQHDPYSVQIKEPEYKEDINESNVYDPRFYGYGTSYRSYNDPMLGQTRFMYDDINAIRMPNYISRSKVDFLPYADSYGPMKPGQSMGNMETPIIRNKVNNSWVEDSLQFRNELSERRMRKVNSEHHQRRLYPKHKGF